MGCREPHARRLRLHLVSTVPRGLGRPLVFSTSRSHVAKSPRRIARLFAGCCLRIYLVRTRVLFRPKIVVNRPLKSKTDQ